MNKIIFIFMFFCLSTSNSFAQLDNELLRISGCGLNFIQVSAKITTRYPTPQGVGLPVQLSISGLPFDCYEIVHAYIWWIVSYNSGSPSSPVVSVTNPSGNSSDYNAVLTGSGGNKCWSEQGTRGFRADIKNSINGNGIYTINVGTPVNETDGLTLLIIYRDLKAKYEGHFVINDGLITVGKSADNSSANLQNFNACDNSLSASALLIASDLQDGAAATVDLVMNGDNSTVQRKFWNSHFFSTNVTKNQTTSNFQILNNSNDCYSWIMMGLYYQTNKCTICPIMLQVNATSNSNEICLGGSVQLNVTGAATYQWTSYPPGFSSSSSNPTVKPTITTDYYVKGISADGCFEGLDTIRVVVNPLPTSNAGADKIICFGDEIVTGSASSSGTPPFTYSWSPPDGLNATNLPTVIAKPTKTTNYIMTVTDSKGCVDSDTINVKVNPLPQPVIIPMGPTTFCSCDSVILDAGGPYNSYQWSTGATTQLITVKNPGSYTVTVTDSNGCKNTSPALDVIVIYPKATINLKSEQELALDGIGIRIPMYITNSENLDTCKVRNYIAKVSLKRSILVPQGNTPKGEIDNLTQKRTIMLTGTRNSNDSLLYLMEFISTLGEDSITNVEIESFKWTDCPFDVDTNNTVFKLDGICRAGGRVRLLLPETSTTIYSIKPHPISDIATIDFLANVDSDVKLFIIDFSGKKISLIYDGKAKKGINQININVKYFNSGVYFIVLETQNQRVSKLIEIEK